MSEATADAVSPAKAVELGLLYIAPSARVSNAARIILYEDDGSNIGLISVGAGAIVRAGTIICSGAKIGAHTVVGHNVIIRRSVDIGDHSVISHGTCLERDCRVGAHVRISALTHITGSCVIEDNVQIGARVVTINDNDMRWGERPPLCPPTFRRGCKVGSGVTVLSGVEIGEKTFVGAGSVVTKSLPPNVIAYGNPAYVQRELVFATEDAI